MSEITKPVIGSIGWMDLTVENAEAIRAFYQKVVGWTHTSVDMGGYHDFCMNQPADEKSVAGICNARGTNAGMPPQWIMYITVANLEESMQRCAEGGGKIIFGPKSYGGQGKFCVMQDPAGAVAALYEANS